MNERLNQFMEKIGDKAAKIHPFYLFEPWDVGPRTDEVYEMAREDEVDLRSPEVISVIKSDPHLFQTGYLRDDSRIAAMFASNQSGKSYCEIIDNIIMLTGELPIALKYKAGEKTPYLREVSENNVMRFGRFDSADGKFIDKKWREPDVTWDCGFVHGAGEYPKNKIAPHNSKIWVVTSKQIRDETWWPAMRHMVPKELIDTTKANQGFDNQEFIIHLVRNAKINLKTYEQKADRLEGSGETQEYDKLVKITFDEEPPSQKFLSVALVRSPMIRLITTPYKGLSWTYDQIFKKGVNVYHCTQYDCPYHSWKDINARKKYMPKWEIGARIYGLHTGQAGRPYYEGLLDLINKGVRECLVVPDYKKLICDRPWDNISELIGQEMIELEGAEDSDDAWALYEPYKEHAVYFISIDTAEGSTEHDDRTDTNAAHIFRFPVEGEPDTWPVHVGSLHTQIPTDEFARLCLYGCIYFNYAMMIPEAMGKSAGTFLAEVRDYPFIFTMNVINDRTRKQTERLGFFTTAKTRIMLFDLMGSMMKDRAEVRHFGIMSARTLKEIAGCIVGRRGRPDHESRGSNDSLIAYSIGLYAYIHSRGLLKASQGFMRKKKPESFFEQMANQKRETRPLLGAKMGMDQRQKQKTGWRR